MMKSKVPSPEAFERVLSGVRAGKTLSTICAARGMPSREAVLRLLSESTESEAAMIRARRIGVWTQLDDIVDQFTEADPSALPMLKELANHVRWLAGKLASSTFSDSAQSANDVIEVRWLDNQPHEN